MILSLFYSTVYDSNVFNCATKDNTTRVLPEAFCYGSVITGPVLRYFDDSIL